MLIAFTTVASRERNGDWWYRTAVPCRALAETPGVWTVEGPYLHRAMPSLYELADALVIGVVGDPQLVRVVRDRNKRGQLTVLDYCDDLPGAGHVRWAKSAQPVLLDLMEVCDGVMFSAHELHRRYNRYTRASLVLHNQIDQRLVRARKPHENFVVGYGGSMGHAGDIAAVAPALIDWLSRNEGVQLMMIGGEPVVKPFLHARRFRWYAPASISTYYDFLSHIDVGIAPLNDTLFNRSRSDVKWLEYSAAGAVGVVQNAVPYHSTVKDGYNGLYFENPDELVQCLDRLRDDGFRLPLMRAANRYIHEKRTPAVMRDTLLSWFAQLGLTVGPAHDASMFSRYDGCTVDGRYISLGFGQHEVDLWTKYAREQGMLL